MSSNETSSETNVAADKDARSASARPSPRMAGTRRGGRKTYAERDPELVAAAKRLARYPVNGRKRTLRDVAAELQAMGYVTVSGKRYAATAVSTMLYD